MKDFDHKMYVRLLRESSEIAEKYRKECGLLEETPKTAPINNEVTKEDITQAKEVETTPTDAEIVTELSIEDMRKILDSNDVKYSHLAKEKGLIKLLEENKLI